MGDSLRSYSCECPSGLFGSDCELHDGSAVAFNGESYARWTLSKDIKTRLNVKLQFRTKQSDAVLMDARGDRDYSTLEVRIRNSLQRLEVEVMWSASSSSSSSSSVEL